MQTRKVLLAGVAGIALIAATAAWAAEDAPSNAELFRMLKQQQEMIKAQQDEIKKLRGELQQTKTFQAKAQQDIATQRKELSRTKQELVVTKKSVDDSKQMVKAEVEKARTEIGTAPSDTVFKLYEMPNRFAATAEVFFLRPSSDNQIYGGLNNSTNSNVQNLTVDSEYDPGFRLGFKYNLGSGFDVRAQYSFLRARSSSSATDPTNANRIFVGYYDNLSVSNATAKFKLDYDVLDFDAGLNFAIGSRVMMRAFTGLRYARLDQTMDATGVRSNGFVDNWKGNADIWGIGPRFGLEGKMRIAGGFNLFGMLGASAPIGSRSGKYVSTRVGNTPQGQTEASRVAVNPSMDATIGISYDYQINQTMAVAFAVGYMFEHWFNTRPITGMTGEGLNSRGNSLTLDGFFLRGMFKW